MYSTKTQSAVQLLNNMVEENQLFISNKQIIEKTNAEKIIDLQCKIASYVIGYYTSGMIAPRREWGDKLTKILLSSFHKNIISLYAAIRMTQDGLFGPARPLLRNVFEWQMIAKFSNLAQDPKVLKKWDGGEHIFLTNAVINRIKKPETTSFSKFWKMLCSYAHATRGSIQIALDAKDEENFKAIRYNFIIINILLECNYHLLNTHLITPELAYLSKFYCSRYKIPTVNWDVSEYKKKCREKFKENREFLTKEAAKLIYAYKRKWAIK